MQRPSLHWPQTLSGDANMFQPLFQKIILVALLAFAVAGCNTVQGVGRDVQQGGEAIERAGS